MDQHKLDALVCPTAGPGWVTDLVNGDHATGDSSSAPAVAGLSTHYRAGRIYVWHAIWNFVLRTRLE